jgi:hypothetical protein
MDFRLAWTSRGGVVRVSDAGWHYPLVFWMLAIVPIVLAIHDYAVIDNGISLRARPSVHVWVYAGVAATKIGAGFLIWSMRRVVTVSDGRVTVDDRFLLKVSRIIDAPVDDFTLVEQRIEYESKGPITTRHGLVLRHDHRDVMLLCSDKSSMARSEYREKLPVQFRLERSNTAANVHLFFAFL